MTASLLTRTARVGVPLALLLAAGPLAAHDFWIVPDAFQIAAGSALTVRTVTGTKFPTSESAVAADRLAEVRLLGASPSIDETLRDFTISGKSLVIQHRPTAAGQRVIAVSLVPSTRRMLGEAFVRYLRLEGAAALADRLSREGHVPTDSITMRSVKYAKTLVEVGTGGPRAFSRSTSHPLEFMPLDDPSALRPGATFNIRVVAHGRAVAGAEVHVGRALAQGDPAAPALTLTADQDGIVHVPLVQAGLWNVRTASAEPSASAPGTWDVSWTTFVFSTGTAPGTLAPTGAAASATSATIPEVTTAAATVAAFHAALARGDSGAAVAMLAADVVVAESGELQSLAEYRGHHLAADIAFARAIPLLRTVAATGAMGDAAWVTATTVANGQFNGRAVRSSGAELMVLSRDGSAAPWRIRAIHWSSRRVAP